MRTSVLVIDSDPGVLNAFKTSLSRWGFVVAGFASIAQGFEALKKEKPQALILDIQLPKPQSLSLLREVKKLYPSLPVITMTAYSTSFTEADAIRQGADAYFVKPFDLTALVRKLELMTNSAQTGAVQNELMAA
jgi:DNA-binding NtrC family response regulator